MTTEQPAALEVRGVTAAYGDHQVLRGVDLTLHSGVTAVLGSSGCGKTTLLRVIAGFVGATGGTVAVAGRELTGGGRAVPPRLRGIGYVPQEGALFPHLDVAANIAFGLPRAERRGPRIDEMLELVELPRALATRAPHELSGGQQQRVALARALAPRPRLVLLDEPFSSLDAGLREETGRSVVRALAVSGAAGVLVTHDQGEALSLADQVAMMDAGQFRQVATPEQVYLAPADEVVAGFIGHVSLVRADVAADGRTATGVLGRVGLRAAVASGPARLAVRAEQVEVLAPDVHEGGADEPGADATVVEVSFFGHDATVRVSLDATGDELVARTPATAIPARGSRVRVRLVGDVVAFEGEGEGVGS